MGKGAQIAIGATLIALLLGWVARDQLGSGASFRYYETLDAFLEQGDSRAGESARVHGYVALGSIERDLGAMRVRFSVQNQAPHAGGPPGELLSVVFESLETPDLFKEGAEVVVEGSLVDGSSGAVFHADKVMAKCPSKFQPEKPGAGTA
jgi:cytochrome c-type biogenesis protein CcmE